MGIGLEGPKGEMGYPGPPGPSGKSGTGSAFQRFKGIGIVGPTGLPGMNGEKVRFGLLTFVFTTFTLIFSIFYSQIKNVANIQCLYAFVDFGFVYCA